MLDDTLYIYIKRTTELIDELDSFVKEVLEEYDEDDQHKNGPVFHDIMERYKDVITGFGFDDEYDYPEGVDLKIGYTLQFITDEGGGWYMTIEKTVPSKPH